MDQSLLGSFSEAVSAAPNFDELAATANRFFEALGGEAVNIGVINVRTNQIAGLHTTMRADWIDHYVSESLFENDVFLAHAFRGDQSTVLSGFSDRELSEQFPNQDISVLQLAIEAGYRNMQFQPVYQMGRPWAGVVTFANSMRQREAVNYRSEFAELVRSASLMVGTRAAQMFDPHQFPQGMRRLHFKNLPPRELEVVQWLASGLRVEEIAFRMNIKPVTVHLHVANARRRLEAKTREQLVAMAYLNGLI